MAYVESPTSDRLMISREELVERARALIPRVRGRASQAEELRKLPPETVEDFKQAGFFRAVVPTRFGGMRHDLEVVVDVAQQVARGCGSSGWLSSFFMAHQFHLGWFTEEAQKEYWRDGPDTLSATVPAFHNVTREEVDGGLRISGTTSFSSGVDYADWALLHTTDETCLVPREDFEIVDDWYVSGLRGTGSRGIRMENVFVPAHRIVTYKQLESGDVPGVSLSDSPWVHVRNPVPTLLGHFLVGPIIGMGYGVLDIFDERARNRMDGQTFLPAIERPGPQLRFAEASAELDVADMLLRKSLGWVREQGAARAPIPVRDSARIRRNVTYATKLVTQACNRLVDGMDSSALYDKNHLHRQARDLRAAALQVTLHWEEAAIQYARVQWGLEPQTFLI